MSLTDKDFMEKRDAKLEALLREAVDDWEEFDDGNDQPTDEAALCEWFGTWRDRVKLALGYSK